MTSAVGHDDSEVATLGRLIGALDDVLRRERAAIAKLDAPAVEAIAQEKQALAAELAALMTPPQGEPIVARFGSAAGNAAQKELRRLAARLVASAEANRALLDDAIDSIATARGLKTPQTGAYDARARVTSRLRIGGGKQI